MRVALAALLFCAWAGAAHAQANGIDPRRVASCQLAAENLRERVQPDTEAHARYSADAVYWTAQMDRFVPDATHREHMLVEGRDVLGQALQQQSYLAGMMMVTQVLDQCNANKSVIEGVSPNG